MEVALLAVAMVTVVEGSLLGVECSVEAIVLGETLRGLILFSSVDLWLLEEPILSADAVGSDDWIWVVSASLGCCCGWLLGVELMGGASCSCVLRVEAKVTGVIVVLASVISMASTGLSFGPF